MTDTTDNAVTDLATDSFIAASPENLDYMLQLQNQGNANKYAPKVHGHTIADTSGLQAALDSKSNISHRHNNATSSADGFMAASDKAKLDSVEAGANLVTNVSELVNDSDYQTGAEVTAAINQAVSATLKWQGAVETVEDLPAASTKGFVYHVNENGGEYAWDGTQWVELGSVVEHKWDSITGKPSTFTPSAHTHSQSDITGLAASLAGKSDTGHTHDDRYYTEAEVNSKLATKSDTSHTHDDRYYTEAEVNSKLAGKANTSHTHAQSDIDGLADTLAGKASTSHTHGAATSSANGFMSATDKAKLDGIASGANKYTHPNSAAGAKASGLYKITTDAQGHVTGATAVAKADITALGIPSTNTTYGLATTSANGLLRQLDGSTAHYMRGDGTWATPPNTTYGVVTQSANGLMSAADKKKLDSITIDGSGNVEVDITIDTALSTSSTNPVQNKVVTAAINGKAASNHTHGVATTSANGFLSATDKAKLDGIASGANKTTVDTALSPTSTNPVQNKVINSALAGKAASGHTHTTAQVSGLGSAATKTISSMSNARDVVAYVATDGVMEIGHIIDFHTADNDGKDFTVRLTAGASNITLSKPLDIAGGGTGATSASAARTALGITPANIGAAASSHNHSASNITSGTLPVSRGGTGQTSAAAVRNSLGLGNTTGAVPIANGGTGATTAAQARANLGITASKPFPDSNELITYCGL